MDISILHSSKARPQSYSVLNFGLYISCLRISVADCFPPSFETNRLHSWQNVPWQLAAIHSGVWLIKLIQDAPYSVKYQVDVEGVLIQFEKQERQRLQLFRRKRAHGATALQD